MTTYEWKINEYEWKSITATTKRAVRRHVRIQSACNGDGGWEDNTSRYERALTGVDDRYRYGDVYR
jgi:hypothetical protein